VCNYRSSSNPQIVPRMVRTISNLHSGSASLPRDVRLSDFDTTGEFLILVRKSGGVSRLMSLQSIEFEYNAIYYE